MELKLGEIYEGKVSGVTKFGAFVLLENGRSGLVHISEIANTFVKDINDFMKVGQTVKVKLIGLNNGKINLSVKQVVTEPKSRPAQAPVQAAASGESGNRDFEDKLKKFMQESDSRMAGNPMYADRGKQRRRR